MTLPLRNDLGGFPHPWSRRFKTICRRCWNLVLYSLARVHGAMPVVLVGKKDGGLQFCIEFCCLNVHMKKDSYPLPRIQEGLESLVGTRHFSCLDLKFGFWQIKMEEASKQYTTFTVCNLGFLKCDHMPFKLCNVPATFQKQMKNCLGD